MNIGFAPHDYSRVIVTAMKDEGPYMLEWLAYHLSIGFTHFVIMTNDCSDGTDKIAKHLEKEGLVTHLNNKAPHPKGIQKTAYARAMRLEAVRNASWLLALDVDEFFRIDIGGDIGSGHLDDLFAAIGDNVLAVSLMWQMFGNNGVMALTDSFVTQQFTQASAQAQANPYQIRGLKTLYKPEYFAKIGTHCPLEIKADTPLNLHWIDGDGVPLPHMREKPQWLATNDATNFGVLLGRINHYAIRSLDGFFLKMDRGFVNRTKRGVRSENSALEYWRMFNWNISENTMIMSHLDAISHTRAKLVEIGNIAQFHARGFEIHQDKITALRKAADWIKDAEDEINALNAQPISTAIDAHDFINPVLCWEFPIEKFSHARAHSILDPKYFLHDKKMPKQIDL